MTRSDPMQVLDWLVRGFPSDGRLVRYAITLAAGAMVIGALALAILLAAPKSYSSGFTLILPGAGPTSSVNLESLGQTTSSSSSPFGSHTLSPTENYKRLFQSYRLRGAVATALGADMADVPAPQIRLANQTKLMYVSVSAPTPVEAENLAIAWHEAFLTEIDALRLVEQSLRDGAYRATLERFEQAVEASRARIIAFQSEYGLISLEQFQDLVRRSDSMRIEAEAARVQADVSGLRMRRLSSLLGISPDLAAKLMILHADPVFQAHKENLSLVETRLAEYALIYGDNHPDMRAAVEERSGLSNAVVRRGRELLGFETYRTLAAYQHATSPDRAELLARLVQSAAAHDGARRNYALLIDQLKDAEARVAALSEPATELDALLRDHQIAENRIRFSARPYRYEPNRFVRVIPVDPDGGISRATGRALVALAQIHRARAAVAAFVLYAIGVLLLWIRLPIIRALLKTI